ncbi:hypothetical protein E6W39_37955 [Kitasatospora acidiphila]|uniref:Uncharacterized protein n=1 Tax=Kitasatospora acidiphila TaxID=2567942 RepID=A0A540WD05_9ACTN|nr:hypothetical protein [Kitasatospora acidiphila]TQF06925.1 hypothetical protein E6W39_37955 [Kitasatospora acidiphila]
MTGVEPVQPGLDEIEARFAAVVEGRVSRDEVDRWASRWVVDDALEWGELEWWALNLLVGVDLPAGPPPAGFLHGDEQLRGWLDELRRSRMS